ncbi:MAG: hypothetical protein A2Z38_06250 [Planctomycetes bacterium RBG_19FT_COMBO_48_8]|nr:MAG: hypothetical protein A2Z38_06250 [Planctomycetes bacterium RBG_19FT_COMBO_48_8]
MKAKWNTRYWIVTIVLAGCVHATAEPFAKGPYLGQTPPGPIAQVFAPGLISDTRPQTWEAFGTFSADANTFCFMRGGDVFITENTNQGWTALERIENIPGLWSPCLSPDANSIFFTIGDRKPWIKHYDLFRCTRTSHGWAKPQRLGPPLSSPAKEITCSIAANNNIYIGSGRKQGHWKGIKGIIWVVPFEGNTWLRDEHVALNLPGGDAGIAPDESFMVFTAKDVPGGYGHRDLYLTLRLPDGTWSKPQNLGPRINAAYIEHGPRISPDKKYLFFTRSDGWDPRKHSADIYWVELKEYLPESYR